MAQYSLKRPIPSCKVPRKLLEELEDYLQTLDKLVPLKQPDSERRIAYHFTVKDSIGAEIFESVRDFDRLTFPNDTTDLFLKYSAKSARSLSIDLTFDKDGHMNRLQIDFDGDSAREVASGISNEILSRIAPHTTFNFIFQTPVFFTATIFVFAAAFSFFITLPIEPLRGSKNLSIILGLALLLLASSMAALKFTKPHTTFETARNDKLGKQTTFIFLGFIGFLLFTVIGVYFRLRLFGF